MPEKTVYTITPKGKEIFTELMTKFSLTETRVFLDFNAVIVNLALLDEGSANDCIANIKNSIQNTKMQILEQQFLLLETLEKWEENITHAAVLHVSQPTLSRQLMQLENGLGVKLLQCSNHY